jgi:hypothetical protein
MKNMLRIKILYVIKALVVYLTLLSSFATLLFLQNISSILQSFNIAAICALVVNLFFTLTNIIFLFRQNHAKDLKVVLICNFIFCLISGITVRIGGFPFANNLGVNFSIGYIQNYAASTFTMNFNWFNMFMNFPERILDVGGFSFQINLIMWGIGVFLISRYRKADKITSVVRSL